MYCYIHVLQVKVAASIGSMYYGAPQLKCNPHSLHISHTAIHVLVHELICTKKTHRCTMNARICSMDMIHMETCCKGCVYNTVAILFFVFSVDAGHAQESVCKKFTELQ